MLRIPTEYITLDVSKPDVQSGISVTQGDIARRWEITLVNKGTPITLDKRWTASLIGIKPDDTVIHNGCVVDKNRIVYDFASGPEIATAAGTYELSLLVYNEYGEVIHTPKIWLNVIQAPYRDMASDDQFTAAQELVRRLVQVEDITDELKKVVDEGGPFATTVYKANITQDCWYTDETGKIFAKIMIPDEGLNSVTTLVPGNEETRKIATEAGLAIHTTGTAQETGEKEYIIESANLDEVPTQDLTFLCFTIRAVMPETNTDEPYSHVATFVGVASGGSGNTALYTGDTTPEKDRYNLWIDTSSEFATLKYKTESGEWIAVSGGGGGGGGTITVLNTSGWISKSVAYGGDFTINLNWSSEEPGDGVMNIAVNGVPKLSKTVAQGDLIIDNIGQYLIKGINKVAVTISDILGSSRTINYTVTTVELSLSSYFDDAVPQTGDIDFAYTPVGPVSKTVYFMVDGVELGRVEGLTESGVEQFFTIPAQSHGAHKLEVYFTAEIDGTLITSNTLRYDLICVVDGETATIVTTSFQADTVRQYSTVVIPYIAYEPYKLTTQVKLMDGDTVISTLEVDRTRQTWSYRAVEAGVKNLSIVCVDTVVSITFTVTESDISVQAENKNLQLYLNSEGRSNNEENPLNWMYNGISATMSNFNLKSDGWLPDENGDTVLRVAGDARVNIPFNIFGSDFRSTGKTIEIEFATRDVMNYDAVVLSCWSGERGIKITAQKATMKSEQSEIFTQYKENEHVRVTFSVEKSAENRLLYIFINGVMSGAVQYPTDDDFSQASPVGISIGSNDCTMDIYCIRVYGNKLSQYQVLNNWIADTQNVDEMVDRYVRNDIFDAYSNIAISKLSSDLPYLVLNAEAYADLPQFKGDKKIVSGWYVDPARPERSFTFEDAEIDVQGTSSQYYARKNYTIVFTNGLVINGVPATAYQLRETSMPTNKFCFKADVASSEGANNVELVRFYEDACPVKTPPQEADSRVRQGVEGYPCVMFYYDGRNYNFLGKYNFNNDKSTNEVFGLAEGDESWEILQNNTAMAMWKDDNFADENWKNTFEGRYPKDNTDTANLAALATWLKSTDTTAVDTDEEKAARLQTFKDEFETWFNKDLMIFNYIFTESFLMVDNRAKNAFPTRYGADGKWLILPYDYDTAIGINNNGALTFGYELEDIDTVDGKPVFNGQDSVLYTNIRLAFADEIKAMYQTLRTSDIFSYEEIEKRFEEHQRVWGESIFNEDARFKYIEPLINDGDNSYLPMLQGSKAEQRKWWLYNRFRYLDSKYEAGDSMSDTIQLYAYAKADVTLTPYADIYAVVKFNSTVVKERALRKDGACTLVNPLDGGNDAVIGICSASQLASLGDLSPLKVGRADFSKAVRISSLKVGDGASGYTNPNLNNLVIGNLTLLKEIDVRNCTALAQSVDLSGCANIEHAYFEGTAITGVRLPVGGILKTLHLPRTVTSLEIRNHGQLTDFTLASSANITTLRLEGVDINALNGFGILQGMPGNARVRVLGIDRTVNSVDDIYTLYDKLDTFRGLDENGNNVDNAVVSGTIHVDKISEEELATLTSRYPNIHIDYNAIGTAVIFMANGKVVSRQFLEPGDAITIPANPVGEVTNTYIETFDGWSLDGVNIVDVPSTMGDSGLIFIAVFTQTTRTYAVRFINIDNTVLSARNYPYGSIPVYPGYENPVHPYLGELNFLGWEPAITAVTGAAEYVAKYEDIGTTREFLMRIIREYSDDSLTVLSHSAFQYCEYLTSIDLPFVTSVEGEAFWHAKNLRAVNIPSATSIGQNAFYGCSSLVSVRLPATPPTLSDDNEFTSAPITCVFYIPTGSLEAYQNATNWSSLTSKYTFTEEDRT